MNHVLGITDHNTQTHVQIMRETQPLMAAPGSGNPRFFLACWLNVPVTILGSTWGGAWVGGFTADAFRWTELGRYAAPPPLLMRLSPHLEETGRGGKTDCHRDPNYRIWPQKPVETPPNFCRVKALFALGQLFQSPPLSGLLQPQGPSHCSLYRV